MRLQTSFSLLGEAVALLVGVCAISKMIWFPGKSMLIAELAAGASKLVELEMQLAVVLGTARAKELAGSLRLLSSPVQRTGASPREARPIWICEFY